MPKAPTGSGAASTRPPLAPRCGAAQVEPVTTFDITGPGADFLSAVELGSGPDGVVLLHQTDQPALCGWLPFARRLAAQGSHVLAFDFCGYGTSACQSSGFRDDQVAQVVAAGAHLRARGATRITLVGASMGGTVALAAATATRADAVVDLSGPVVWPPYDSRTLLPTLTMPVLVAVNEADAPRGFAQLREAVAESPARTARFVAAPRGTAGTSSWTSPGRRPRSAARCWPGLGAGPADRHAPGALSRPRRRSPGAGRR